MTTQNEQLPPADEGRLDLRVVPLVERLGLRVLMKHGGTADPWEHHWNLTEGDSLLHRDAADEIRRQQSELGQAPRWWTCKTHGSAMPQNAWGCPACVEYLRHENALLRTALDKIAERTSSDDPCRALVKIARDALRHNGALSGPQRPEQEYANGQE